MKRSSTAPVSRRRGVIATVCVLALNPLWIGVAQAGTKFATIYSFAGGDGAGPTGTPVVDATGAIYGVTDTGGATNGGAIFRLVPPPQGSGTQGAETVLYSFPLGHAGQTSRLTIDADGTLYGTTLFDGKAGLGTVFALSPIHGGTSWRFHTIFNFTDGNSSNALLGGVTIGPDKALYVGTSHYPGTIYRLTQNSGKWVAQTIYAAQPGLQPPGPQIFATPINFGTDGSMYGTSVLGPNGNESQGTVWRLSPSGSGYVMTVLANGGYLGDALPDPSGVIYVQDVSEPVTTITQLSPVAGSTQWTASYIALFGGKPGQYMNVGLHLVEHPHDGIRDLFGTLGYGGGRNAVGLVFKLSYEGQGAWLEQEPHVFYESQSSENGLVPAGGLAHVDRVGSQRGVYYGVTSSGGVSGLGTVYRITN